MKNDRLSLRCWRKAILVVFVLMWIGAFTATHVPMRVFPEGVADLGHVILHTVGFAGLSSWFILTVEAFGLSRVRQVVVVLLVMSIYGAVDEYTQQFFGRSTRWQDWLTDTVATMIALVLWQSFFVLASRIVRKTASQTG